MAEVDYVLQHKSSLNHLKPTQTIQLWSSLSLQTRLTNDTKRDFRVKLWSTCSSGITDLHDTGLITICRYV